VQRDLDVRQLFCRQQVKKGRQREIMRTCCPLVLTNNNVWCIIYSKKALSCRTLL
jgi:hypothetical protein